MLRCALLVALVGCPKPAPVEPVVSPAPPPPPPQDDVLAVTWAQTSAEADAVALTVYHAAAASLDRALADPTWTAAAEQSGDFGRLPPAIVVDVDETVPNLLGQIPLEYLDSLVDPKGQRLIPNPEHGDKLMTEEY